jgi:hypothetical protein
LIIVFWHTLLIAKRQNEVTYIVPTRKGNDSESLSSIH